MKEPLVRFLFILFPGINPPLFRNGFGILYDHRLRLAFDGALTATYTARFYYAEGIFDHAFHCGGGTVSLTKRTPDTFRFVYMHALYRAVSGRGGYADRGAGFRALPATCAFFSDRIIVFSRFFLFFDRAERADISAISAVYAFLFVDSIRHCRAP